MGIPIAKSSPPPKAANTQQPKAANTIPEPTCPYHLSTPAPETSIKVSTVEASCPKPPPFQPLSLSTPSFHRKVSIVEASCPKPPPFQPPSLYIPSFHHRVSGFGVGSLWQWGTLGYFDSHTKTSCLSPISGLPLSMQ